MSHPRTTFMGRISNVFEDTVETYKPSHPIVFVVITNEYYRDGEGKQAQSTNSWLCKIWPINKSHFNNIVERFNIGNLIEIHAEVRFGYYQDKTTGEHKHNPYMNVYSHQMHQQMGDKSPSSVRENDVEIDYHSQMYQTPPAVVTASEGTKPKANQATRGRKASSPPATELKTELDDDLPF